MAEDLGDGEFWLPPEFLTDDDLLLDLKTEGNDGFSLGFIGNSFGPNSDLSSPVESVMGSTETESDEDEYLTELSRKLPHSTLQGSKAPFENSKGWGLSRSPQSTLYGVMGGRGGNQGSSSGNPSCASLVSSPPGVNRNSGASWDTLYAAAGEVARMSMMEEATGFYSSNRNGGLMYGAPQTPSSIFVPLENTNRGSGFYHNRAPQISYQQLQAAQFQQLKKQQMKKQQQQGSGVWGQLKDGYSHVVPNYRRNGGRPQGLSMSAWPPLQQPQRQSGTGVRAMFLGDPSAKKERSGTGVFLPRRVGAPTETRKKPATVLLPDKVVQALNLNLGSLDPQPQVQSKGSGCFTPSYDPALKCLNNSAMGQQMHHNVRPPQKLIVNQELRLPQEWTY